MAEYFDEDADRVEQLEATVAERDAEIVRLKFALEYLASMGADADNLRKYARDSISTPRPAVCETCCGDKRVMYDHPLGPKSKVCPACHGTGKPPQGVDEVISEAIAEADAFMNAEIAKVREKLKQSPPQPSPAKPDCWERIAEKLYDASCKTDRDEYSEVCIGGDPSWNTPSGSTVKERFAAILREELGEFVERAKLLAGGEDDMYGKTFEYRKLKLVELEEATKFVEKWGQT